MKIFKPTPGPFSMMDDLSQRLLRRWVPKWHTAFTNPDSLLFFERLGHSFRPVSTGRARLLGQCRQLAMYAHAVAQPECGLFKPDLKAHFDSITRAYRAGAAGTWVFALDDSGTVVDETRDLYTHAFVIFALSRYGLATGDRAARESALATIGFIDTAFRQGVAQGFTEALDAAGKPLPTPRRHESHMHLLEACLFAHDVWGDSIFLRLADEITVLFFSAFYDADENILGEYFTNDLKPAPDAQKGHIICEPGHYYEWVWLLKKYACAKGNPSMHDAVCLRLLGWANRYGWDETHGGIYDELGTDGGIVADTKRLWPFTEAIKANALMLNIVHDRDAAKDRMTEMTKLFRDRYMQERGFWTEWLNRDLTPAVEYMPATTPYHVYFGIMETREILKSRGASKSWRAGPRRLVYTAARFLSALVRGTRRKLLKSKAV